MNSTLQNKIFAKIQNYLENSNIINKKLLSLQKK